MSEVFMRGGRHRVTCPSEKCPWPLTPKLHLSGALCCVQWWAWGTFQVTCCFRQYRVTTATGLVLVGSDLSPRYSVQKPCFYTLLPTSTHSSRMVKIQTCMYKIWMETLVLVLVCIGRALGDFYCNGFVQLTKTSTFYILN